MENKYSIPDDLRGELVKLLGEKEAAALIDEKQGNVTKLQSAYFVKKFKKQFGIDIRIVIITFGAVFMLYGILRMING
ncbi:MAG: hypothetical protein U5L09_11080 [Bacteroidales bacterium]|nr:hypothetical protein [Bacteroidales bacterium]